MEILDPATGTGTFICDIIDFLPKNKVAYKYKNELHANELAILPYYIANLNIEYTYKQKTSEYAEFENLCLVDTLDNTGFHWVGKQGDLFGVSAENAQRIKKQNERKISVIIGNPPYNANQQNENENNKNREYPAIDKRIKETFIKNSTAQKTKLYDMYSRFYRWAMDRLNENGVIAFITNRSFIDSRTFDGFRKSIQTDFDHAYIIDTRSDVRANPRIAGTTHNVFGIQTGVAILFLVKSSTGQIKQHNCKIHYISMEDEWRKEEKLKWLTEHPIEKIEFGNINPDKNNNWINQNENNWENLISVENPDNPNEQLFSLVSNGVNTARDEWVFDQSEEVLKGKISFFIKSYTNQVKLNKSENEELNKNIKWSEALKNHLRKGTIILEDYSLIHQYNYRPYYKTLYYSEKVLSDRLTGNHYRIFGRDLKKFNLLISFSGVASSKSFSSLATKTLFSFDFLEKTQCLPLYLYTTTNEIVDNITDWGLEQFTTYYKDKEIAKEDIFYYCYAVLHHPAYRKKYEINLKREFPRIPFYENFWHWMEWGKELMTLHIEYEKIKPYPLKLITLGLPKGDAPKSKLKADKAAGIIVLDEVTELHGIPAAAWEYKLGNRSALEWILDQYKEKKPSDPTIVEKLNTYKFADYKEKVIDLLMRVCTVSVETMKIVNSMPE